MHRWRAEVDAVCVGIGTALADDPLLTARTEGVTRQPTRVVFDSEARLPLESNLVRTAPEVPLVIVASRAADRARREALRAAGAEVVAAAGGTERERVHRRARQAGRRWASRACCSRAARGWRARSSTPERSTRCGSSSLRSRSAAAPRACPLEGEGSETIARRSAGALGGREHDRRGRADPGASSRVVARAPCSRDWSRSSAASSRPCRRTAGRAPADRGRAARRSWRGRLGAGERRLPDGDGARAPRVRGRPERGDARAQLARRARSRATTSTSSCRSGRPTGSAGTSCRATSTASARSPRCARPASRGRCGSRLPLSCCATWSRRARSRSTA